MATPYHQISLVAVFFLVIFPIGCGRPEAKVQHAVEREGSGGKGFWLSRSSIKSDEQITLSFGQSSEEGAGGPSRTFDQNFARAVIGRKLERGEQLFVHDFKVEFSTAVERKPGQEVDLDAKDDRKGIWFVDDSGRSIAMNYKAEKPSSRDRAAHRSPWRSVKVDRNLVTLVVGRNLNRDESAFAYEPKMESDRKASADFADRGTETALATENEPVLLRFDDSVPSVTAKMLEVFGEKYRGKTVQMSGCRFVDVDSGYANMLADGFHAPEYRDRCGFFVRDSKGDLFQLAFASKDTYGTTLLELKCGAAVALKGKCVELPGHPGFGKYALICTEIKH
jgi:hypothetical protein